ncbi:MAG TPA: nucleoside recognition domain-containing protein [Bacillota bacterium]
MLNKIWFALFFLGFMFAGATGRIEETTAALFTSMETTVKFALGLIGFLAFWSGILRITEEAKILPNLARLFNPLFRRLFPNLPLDAPVLGAISLSLSANLLGLSNASTPLGLKAMEELNKFNPAPDEVSDEIATYLALVMGGICILPSTIIAVRAQAGSHAPEIIIIPILLATVSGTIAALLAHKGFKIIDRLRSRAQQKNKPTPLKRSPSQQ